MNSIEQTEGELRPNAPHMTPHESGNIAAGPEQRGVPECDGPAANAAPRGVIRGESLAENGPSAGERIEIFAVGNGKTKVVTIPLPKADGEPQAALTDYLNTTFPFDPSPENRVEFVRNLRLMLGEAFGTMEQRRGGLHGYTHSFSIGDTGALFAYGGQRGTAFASFPGSACAQIGDWHAVYHLFHEVLNARITRWDGAVDVFDGKPSVDDAVGFYQSGQFNAGGAQPSCNQNGNWIAPDGRGRTFYVGKRTHGKMLRVYEKGKQLGDPESPWVRWELELHNRDRIIPWEVLLEPGKYLAAAYPCMAWVNDVQVRIRTIKETARLNYGHLTHSAQVAYGRLINVMLEVEGSPEKVVEQLRRKGIPARLDCAGLPPAAVLAANGGPVTE